LKNCHASFASSRPGQQGLTGTRRSNQKNTFGHFSTQALEVLWVFKEFGHLFEIGHCLSGPANIFEGHSGLLALNHARLAFPKEKALPIEPAPPLFRPMSQNHRPTIKAIGRIQVRRKPRIPPPLLSTCPLISAFWVSNV
jgi:hypothetical protein